MSLDIKRVIPHQFTSVQHKLRQFGATLPPAFCMFVCYEQKCVERPCKTFLPSEAQSCLRPPSTMASESVVISCTWREELSCNLDAILILAWFLHEMRLGDADPLLRSIELPHVSAQYV